MALTDNILAYWKLDDDGSGSVSLIDSTGNANSLTNSGGVTLGTGIIAGDSVFDGANRLYSDTFGVNVNADFSVGFWINTPSGFNSEQHIFGAPFQNGLYIGGSATQGAINIKLYNGNAWGGETGILNANEWYYVTLTRSGNNLYSYLNGIEISNVDISGETFSASPVISIGGGEFNEYFFTGQIDEVGTWNRALSSSEVASLYNSGYGKTYPFLSLTDGCQAYWKLDDDGSGAVSLVDSTGNSNTLTNNNGVALGTGKIAGDAIFDGSNYLNISPSSLNFGTGDFSISTWIKASDSIQQYPTAFLSQTYAAPGVSCYVRDSIVPTGIRIGAGGSEITIPASINTEEWYHVVLTRLDGTGTVYINGSNAGSSAMSGGADMSSLWIGSSDYGLSACLNGQIDEFGVWNRALSESEVAAIYNSGSGKTYPFQPTPVAVTNHGAISSNLSPYSGGGSSYLFDGTGYLSAPAGSWFAPNTGDFTIDWWQYQTSLNGEDGHPRVFTIGTYPSTSIAVSIEAGTFYLWINGSYVFSEDVTSGLIDSWNYFQIVRSSGTITIYRNGSVIGTPFSNSDDISNTTTDLWIGSEPDGSGGRYSGFIGNIADFRWESVAVGDAGSVPIVPRSSDANTSVLASGLSPSALILYYTAAIDPQWETLGNWNTAPDGSGDTPTSIPWVDGYYDYDLVDVNMYGINNNSVISSSVSGVFDCQNLYNAGVINAGAFNIAYGFTNDGIVNDGLFNMIYSPCNNSGTINGGDFSGSGVQNNNQINGGSFILCSYFINYGQANSCEFTINNSYSIGSMNFLNVTLYFNNEIDPPYLYTGVWNSVNWVNGAFSSYVFPSGGGSSKSNFISQLLNLPFPINI